MPYELNCYIFSFNFRDANYFELVLAMQKIYVCSFLVLLVSACTTKTKDKPTTGKWLAQLQVSNTETLPFNFRLSKTEAEDYSMMIYNAEEEIPVTDIRITGDSIFIGMDVFEGYIAATYSATEIEGSFIKESLDRVVPFHATYGEEQRRFNLSDETAPTVNVSGIWETEFSPNTEDRYMAKGIFKQEGASVTGTFRTTTGDYRYLEGRVSGDSMKLSAFDGAHAFLFSAAVSDSSLNGTFYSGNHFQEPFSGVRNENFELPNPDSLTYLKEGYDTLSFSFPDADGNIISLDDQRFKNKVVLVQILGTWCPNCLDETKFYVDYLNTVQPSDVAIIGLAFEYAKTEASAFDGIRRLQKRIGVPYDIVLAQYGTSDKKIANEKLPMLNHVLSYPTTIYVDKSGKVRKIHTGFNGPATGKKFTDFKAEFHDFISKLSAE